MNDLLEFALDFRENTYPHGAIPDNQVVTYKIQDVTGVLWLREPPYQVELFIVPPHTIIPEHTHPNVASYEMFIGGDIAFSHSGRWVTEDNYIRQHDDTLKGTLIEVKTSDLHGGAFGPSGGVFMSIQKWINDKDPHSVAYDYDGVVMGEHHLSNVKEGEAVNKRNLTWHDAASLETEEPHWMQSNE